MTVIELGLTSVNGEVHVAPKEDKNTKQGKTALRHGDAFIISTAGVTPVSIAFRGPAPFPLEYGLQTTVPQTAPTGRFPYDCSVRDQNGNIVNSGGGEIEIGI